MNLGVGLTFLRKYNYAELGYIYQAFFSLSIGIERLIKLMLLYEFLYLNEQSPPKNFLKSKGHDLNKLFKEASDLATKYGASEYFGKLNETNIPANIISNLSDFAVQNRYFQLDKLSGSTNSQDPVARWDKEVNTELVVRYFNPNTPNNLLMMELSKTMGDWAMIRHHDEQDNEINKPSSFIHSNITMETKQKYGMFYCFCIVKALCELQYNMNTELHSNAYLNEFFMIFRMEYSDAKRKKSWNPHSPYKF